jgi:hypothetical protein
MKTIFSHIIFFLLLCQLISSCGSSETDPSAKEIVILESDTINKDYPPEYLDIEPVSKSDSVWEYEYLGMNLELIPESKIDLVNGPDFQVIGMNLLSGQRVNIYQGMHPQRINGLWFINTRYQGFTMKDSIISSALENNNHFVYKENVPKTIYLNDTIPVTTYDSLYIETFITDSNFIWICKPLENVEGRIDIMVESKNPDKDWKYHFFGNSESLEQSEKVINLAKQISL